MSKEPKFKLGDIVRHSATTKSNGRKMIILSVGSLKDDGGETVIYALSGEKDGFAAKDDSFFRVILQESELLLHEAKSE